MVVQVLVPNVKGRAIIQCDGEVYIIPALGYFTNQEMQYDVSKGIKVPSLLYGLAILYEDNLEDAVKFIKENW